MIQIVIAALLIVSTFCLWRISYYLQGVVIALDNIHNQLYEIDLSLNQ